MSTALLKNNFKAPVVHVLKTLRDFPENPFVHETPLPQTESKGRPWDGLGAIPTSDNPEELREMKSQHWGGVVSCAGTLFILTAGDGEGYFATSTFLTAEAILMKWGDVPFGSFVAWTLINTGSIALFFSRATEHNPYLQATLAAQTLNNLCRGTEWPLQCAQAWLKNRAPGTAAFLKRVEDHVPLVTNGASMVLRIPTIITSAIGGNYTMLVSNTIWIGADCLLGKVQDSIGQFRKLVPPSQSKPPPQNSPKRFTTFPKIHLCMPRSQSALNRMGGTGTVSEPFHAPGNLR